MKESFIFVMVVIEEGKKLICQNGPHQRILVQLPKV